MEKTIFQDVCKSSAPRVVMVINAKKYHNTKWNILYFIFSKHEPAVHAGCLCQNIPLRTVHCGDESNDNLNVRDTGRLQYILD
jgi:hypothetical protein